MYLTEDLESQQCFKYTRLCLLINNRCFALYGSLKCKKDLSISSWLIRLSNVFVFPDEEPPAINILYEWSGICG